MSSFKGKPYPWQQAIWHGLISRHKAGKLPHALLFAGSGGMGKQHLAWAFAQAVLCDSVQDEGTACQTCRSCQLFNAGNHPDFQWLEPEEEGKDLNIKQIRALAGSQELKSQYSGYKVLVLHPADKMNANAANALLKTLEEPTPGTLIILCSSRPGALLPTIRSRCQLLTFKPPAASKELNAWVMQRVNKAENPELLLSLAGGAPLAAVALVEEGALVSRQCLFDGFEALRKTQSDPVLLAANTLEYNLEQALNWLYGWYTDMIRLKTSPKDGIILNPDLLTRLQALAVSVDLRGLHMQLQHVQESISQARSHANAQLLLEDVFIAWAQAGKSPVRISV
ncbi:MAG: DNA polymerase III subunit delta' [Gammaproteobacteria bacterium]|nr:DNA polymerase III subunit delta' [Gammaproteobacteria bacterium]